MAKMLAKEVAAIWDEKGMPKRLSLNVTKAYAKRLKKGLSEGYGADLDNIDYTTPDAAVISQLLTNVYQFSAAKNHAQMVALSRALLDENNKVRSWEEFKAAAFAINNEHTTTWLQAEYNLAVSSAQMAAKWKEINADGKRKLLEFDAVLDAGTTQTCRSLEGVRKWSDDSFWDMYYPPNHYGCRSTVRILSSGRATASNRISYPDIPPIFRTNLAKTGLLFPDNHPYWIGMPEAERRNAIKLFPYDMQFDEVEIEGIKGRLRIHKLLKPVKDYQITLDIATELAMEGKKVDIMPDVKADPVWGAILFPGGKPGKSTDLRIDGVLWEIESSKRPWNFNNIKHAIDGGYSQANNLIIDTGDFEIDDNTWYRLLGGRFKDHTELQNLTIRGNGKRRSAQKKPGKP